jgi:4-amino-4-deoxy-L-arabinose transferase-like glycosyltransferase
MPRSQVRVGVLLGAILVVAFLLRFLGTRFGFPLLLHPDEPTVVQGAIDMARRNSFEPPYALRPDHVEMKLDYIAFAVFAIIKGAPAEVLFAHDPVPFYWMGRLITASFGMASVFFAFLVGARVSRNVGLVAAALFAVFPPFVLHAHYVTPDVPLTFALLLMTYALMRYVESTSWPSLLWACFAVALAIAIKYPGAVGAVMIGVIVVAAAVRDRAWLRILTHGAGSLGATIGFLFLISAKLFTDFSGVRHELSVQSAGDRLGHPDHGLMGNMAFYVGSYSRASGLVLIALGILGVVVAARLRRLDLVPWLTGLLVWASLSTLPMTWDRWGMPMWVTPLLFAALGFCALAARLARTRLRWLTVVVGVVVLANLAVAAIGTTASLLAPDNRSASLAWAHREGVTATNSMYEGYTPFRPGAPELFFNQVHQRGAGYSFSTLKGKPAQYVVLSSGMYARVLGDPAYKTQARVYRWIFANCKEMKTFAPSTPSVPGSVLEPVDIARSLRLVSAVVHGSRSGPTILVYRTSPKGHASC